MKRRKKKPEEALSPHEDRGRGFSFAWERWAGPAVFLSALLVRLIYLIQVKDSPIFEVLLIDSETYDRFARMILDGVFRGEEIYAMNLLYPYFLAGIYQLFGKSFLAVAVVQVILDAASCALIYRIAIRFFDRRVALLSAAMAVFYGPLIFYTGTLLTPTLINFCLLLSLFLLVRSKSGPRWPELLFSGFFLGLAVLGRGNSVLLLGFAVPFFYLAYSRWKTTLTRWLVFAGVTLLLPVLATLRNYSVEGAWVPISANYAAFYSGHNEAANGLYTMVDLIQSADFEGEVLGAREAVGRILKREVTLAETSEYLFDQGLVYAATHPREELVLLAKKFYFFWNTTEAPTNLNYYFARDFSSLLWLLPLTFGVVAPLALLGFLLTRRNWRSYVLLYGYLMVYLLTAVIFFVSAEYRMPAVPVLLMFASASVVYLVDEVRRWFGPGKTGGRAIVFHVFLLAVLAFCCNVKTELLELQSLKRVDYLNFGTLYYGRGDLERAERLYRESLEIDPKYGPAYAAMANLYQKKGDGSKALEFRLLSQKYALGGQYRQGAMAVDEGALLVQKGASFYRVKQYVKAHEWFVQALDFYETAGNGEMVVRTSNNVGLCLYKAGHLDSAATVFETILSGDPGYLFAYTNLARVREAQGRTADAVFLYKKALEINPEFEKAQNALIRLNPD